MSGATPTLVPAYGNYLNDLSLSGGFDYPDPLTFIIEIDGVLNGTDTYRWSTDGGNTFVEEKQQIVSGLSQSLTHGLSIVFTNKTGHHIGDRWSFVARPSNQIVKLSDTKVAAIDGKRTKLRLFDAIQNLYELGELSIHPRINEYDDSIYLRHINDLSISGNVSVTGNSLSKLNYSSADDNMILATVADSTLPQPFGSTWTPTEARNYVIFAVAEDFSGNRVSSGAVVVSVLEAEGKIPVIELNSVSSPISFSGGTISQTLTAEGYDPDGTIATVDFYSNAELVGSDNTRPYGVSFDLNTTGHYELYAVARDNEGNLVTSNVEHLVIDAGGEEPEHALTVDGSEVFVGGTLSVSSNFKSRGGSNNYAADIRAMVYINGLYEGDATKMPRTPPQLGQQDPGQSFIFEKEARGVGSYEVEFLILNGDETSSATSFINISESPLTDDYLFIENLWNGMFDRDPQAFEISKFLKGLSNGSMKRAQILEHLRSSSEFIDARNNLLIHKTYLGEWRTTQIILADQAVPAGSLGGGSSGTANSPPDAAGGGTTANSERPDDGDNSNTATVITMNETIYGTINNVDDVDWFRIEGRGMGQDGVLNLEILGGHTGVEVNSEGGGYGLQKRLEVFDQGATTSTQFLTPYLFKINRRWKRLQF